MAEYKPKSLEEILANLHYCREKFDLTINYFRAEFNRIANKYNPKLLQICSRVNSNDNPYATYETEMTGLAYAVHGFANTVYHVIANAISYWYIKKNRLGNPYTSKNYDQGLLHLKGKSKMISPIYHKLLGFRKDRNSNSHYGKLIFTIYIFQNSDYIKTLLEIVEKLLIDMKSNGTNAFDNEKYEEYLEKQTEFLVDMRKNLSNFDNQHVV